jgi:hypothetical protein
MTAFRIRRVLIAAMDRIGTACVPHNPFAAQGYTYPI